MFASFFQSTPTVHCFENSKNFESARYFLNALRKKKDEFEDAKSSTDETLIDYKKQQKFEVISRLIEVLDKHIAYFDSISATNKLSSNLTNELELSKALSECCLEALGSDYQLLVKPRNDNRKMADTGMKWGSAGLAVGAATLLPVSIVGVAVIGGILVTGQVARYLTGTNDPRALSAYLLVELTRSLLLVHGELKKQNDLILQDALDVFGLNPDFEESELKSRYQELSLTCCPDLYPEQEPAFDILTNAHDILLRHTAERIQHQERTAEKPEERWQYKR